MRPGGETFADPMRSVREMRKLLLITGALVALIPGSAMAQKPKLAATLAGCTTGQMPAERSLKVTGSMPGGTATSSMWMRFELQQKVGQGTYKKVKVPAWHSWMKSDRDVPGFVVERQIDSLAPAAAYRVVVQYRWYNAAGKRVRTKVRTSKVCRQPTAVPTVTPG